MRPRKESEYQDTSEAPFYAYCLFKGLRLPTKKQHTSLAVCAFSITARPFGHSLSLLTLLCINKNLLQNFNKGGRDRVICPVNRRNVTFLN